MQSSYKLYKGMFILLRLHLQSLIFKFHCVVFRSSSIPVNFKKDSSSISNRRRSFCGTEDSCFSGFYRTVLSEDQIKKLLLRHMQQISCNVHTVTTLTWVESNDSLKQETIFGKQELSFKKEHRQIALALYPTSCLLNHACDPDVIVRYLLFADLIFDI